VNEERIRKSLVEFLIPHHMHDGIVLYLLHGIEPGGFMTAVICNDLKNAFGRADHINREAMFDYVNWFYNAAPSECWGSVENMNDWIKSRRAIAKEAVLPKGEQ
jgi:hypothetical protein